MSLSIWKAFPALEVKLRELVADPRGLVAKQISAELSACFGFLVSRNSIIGRSRRLGLKLPQAVVEPTPEQRLQREQRRRDRRHEMHHRLRQNAARNSFPQPPKNPVVYTFGIAKQRTEPTPVEQLDSDMAIPISQRRTLMELTAWTCRWPVGDPRSPDFFYCGGLVVEGCPYCLGHARIAYQPPEARRRSSVPAQMREAAE